jgi:hypothetical protein
MSNVWAAGCHDPSSHHSLDTASDRALVQNFALLANQPREIPSSLFSLVAWMVRCATPGTPSQAYCGRVLV